jgi:hypothetical protein
MYFERYFPKRRRALGIQVGLPENVEWSVELNRNMLCVYGLSKGRNSGMTEYINLELSGNDNGDDKKRRYLHATTTTTTTLLHLHY